MKSAPSVAKLVAAALMFSAPFMVLAQAFPSKPMHVIVPFPPGAVLDTMARLVGQKVGLSTGQPVVVENRAGANGMIGSEFVARSAPDGKIIKAAGIQPE